MPSKAWRYSSLYCSGRSQKKPRMWFRRLKSICGGGGTDSNLCQAKLGVTVLCTVRARQKHRDGICHPDVFGLPERIRTVDLQSRSLTRYPAVPRVDILLFVSECNYNIFWVIFQVLFRKLGYSECGSLYFLRISSFCVAF